MPDSQESQSRLTNELPGALGAFLAASEARNAHEFQQSIVGHPECLSDQALAEVHTMSEHPGFAELGKLYEELLITARTDPAAGWQRFQAVVSRAHERGQDFEGIELEIRAALLEGRFEDADRMAQDAFAYAEEFGLGLVAADVHSETARALVETTSGDRAENIEAASRHAFEALPYGISPEHSASLLMSFASTIALRKFADPAENLETAFDALRAALKELDGEPPSRVKATVQTNLAHVLHQRVRNDRLENLREAKSLCLKALEYRSPKRNAEDWAYTQLNLGSVYDDLARHDEALFSEAEQALLQVIDATKEFEIPRRLVAHAHGSLGAIHRSAAERIARDERLTIGPAPQAPPTGAELEHLEAAQDNLQIAAELVGSDEDREFHGRVLNDLGAVLDARGDPSGATAASRQALDALGTVLLPDKAIQAGSRLGSLLAESGEWQGAASAFSAALRASEFSFHSRLETADRDQQLRRSGNLARWAAFALARTGKLDEAAAVLENGRTRELRRRLDLDTRLERLVGLPTELVDAYVEAREGLATSGLGATSAVAARSYQEVVAAVRSFEGFEEFATDGGSSGIVGAIEPDCPLIYVNPTPHGTLMLSVVVNDGTPSTQALFLDSPTSHDIFMAIVFTDLSDPDRPVSYAAGASGAHEDQAEYEEFLHALDVLLGQIGEGLARALAAHIAELPANRVTLVPCGPLGLVPLQAAPWATANGTRCLLDSVEVRYAPSAVLHAACLKRASKRNRAESMLVALGNPDLNDPELDLPGAEAEMDEIADMFPEGHRRCARRAQAGTSFFEAQACEATHLHLACHGQGGLLDPGEAGFHLADGFLSGVDLTGHELQCRVAVLSACQTAISSVGELPDEVFSLSTACLAAGSACAIASLWSVDDAATALLMCKLYEELLDGRTPPDALRHAQLWLRDLSADGEAQFLAGYPLLEAEIDRRRKLGRSPGRHRGHDAAKGSGGRYSSPEYWAPFVAVGA